jgi:ribosomal protein S18 acetylase RimI-like enzyme
VTAPVEVDAAVIEAARPSDALDIVKLQYLCYQEEAARYADYTIPPLTETVESMSAGIGSMTVLVARLGGTIVGSVRARADGPTCHLGRLAVHPRCRRHGLGTRLVLAIVDRFPHAARIELFAGGRSTDNLRLYAALGFREIRRERVSDLLDMVYLEKVVRPE